jgi:hypothetical protein
MSADSHCSTGNNHNLAVQAHDFPPFRTDCLTR